eukprot:12236648-Alexandrium_andersonii.AAC.1
MCSRSEHHFPPCEAWSGAFRAILLAESDGDNKQVPSGAPKALVGGPRGGAPLERCNVNSHPRTRNLA